MSRFRLLIEYDGGLFSGWQRQLGMATVQGALEEALAPLCGREVAVVGAGRTDAGVHALGQVAHFDTDRPRSAYVYLRALNASTPFGISILEVSPATDDFHARHSAYFREYSYRIQNRAAPPAIERGRLWHQPRPLDVEAMNLAAASLLGTHDFSAFRASTCQATSPVRTIDQCHVRRRGELVEFVIGGRSFLHHMVRNIVGSLVMVGRGEWDRDRFAAILAGRDRTKAAATAPACGLYLVRVLYP